MKVEIDVDVVEIVKNTLREDWDMISLDIRVMKAERTIRTLETHEKGDLKSWKKIRKALKVMIRYYYPHEEAEKILNKEKVLKCLK